MVQLWRWLVVTVLNGEYLDWCGAPTLLPAKPSLAQLAALEMIGEHVRDFCGSPLESWNLPNFRQLMQSKSFDYSGDEVTHALPLRLESCSQGFLMQLLVAAWMLSGRLTMRCRRGWGTQKKPLNHVRCGHQRSQLRR